MSRKVERKFHPLEFKSRLRDPEFMSRIMREYETVEDALNGESALREIVAMREVKGDLIAGPEDGLGISTILKNFDNHAYWQNIPSDVKKLNEGLELRLRLLRQLMSGKYGI